MTLLSNKKRAAIFIDLSFIFLSCTMDNSNSNNGETLNYEYLGDNFVRGFDLSAVDYWENDYAPNDQWAQPEWYDTDGSQKSIYAILKNHGIDTVRIRVWVDPENAPVTDESWPASKEWNTGDCTTERAVRMAKAAKDAGLKVLLDFHYSDYWTDPGKQVIPLSWQNITTKEGLAAKVSEYTTEVLTALKDGNATPDYVQVGNEIDSGILIHTSYNASSGAKPESNIAGKMSSANFNAYLKAGCDAVRAFDKSIKIMIHVTNEHAIWAMGEIAKAGIDYDIIGLSYYSWEENHRTIAELKSNISYLKKTYKKAVMVAESSSHWKGTGDSHASARKFAADHMINPATGRIYSNLETETYGGNVLLVGSIENQKNVFAHIMQESADAGGSGIFAWGGERRADWKYAFFDWDGKALESLDVFKKN